MDCGHRGDHYVGRVCLWLWVYRAVRRHIGRLSPVLVRREQLPHAVFHPLIAIALLYAVQAFIGRFAAPVTGGDRAASAFAGIAVGMPFTCTVAGMLRMGANARHEAREKSQTG